MSHDAQSLSALATVEAAARLHRVEVRIIRAWVRSGRLRTTTVQGREHVDLGRVGDLLEAIRRGEGWEGGGRAN